MYKLRASDFSILQGVPVACFPNNLGEVETTYGLDLTHRIVVLDQNSDRRFAPSPEKGNPTIYRSLHFGMGSFALT
jgi:hypothetical protein